VRVARPRIVITGLGGICALGSTADAIRQSMRLGIVGVREISTVPLYDLKVRIGGEIAELPEHSIDRRRLVTMDRFSLLAAIAAGEALAEAGLGEGSRTGLDRIGAVVGTGICGWEAIEESYRAVFLEGKTRAGVFTVPRVMPGAAAGQVSMNLGLRGTDLRRHLGLLLLQPRFRLAVDQLLPAAPT
jgi:nodulation protein E